MDLSLIIPGLILRFPIIGSVLTVLGMLVVLGQAYVAITPTQNDDAWFAKLEAIPLLGAIIKFAASFAPIQRKP